MIAGAYQAPIARRTGQHDPIRDGTVPSEFARDRKAPAGPGLGASPKVAGCEMNPPDGPPASGFLASRLERLPRRRRPERKGANTVDLYG